MLLGTRCSSILLPTPSLGSGSLTRFLSSHQGHLLDKQPPREPGGPSGDSLSFTSRSCCSSKMNRALLFLEDVQNIAGIISPFSPGSTEHPECTGRQNNHGRVLRRDCLSLEDGRSHLHIFDCAHVFCYCFCFKM